MDLRLLVLLCAVAESARAADPGGLTSAMPVPLASYAQPSDADIDAARGRVNEARSNADRDPGALEDAIAAFGDALSAAGRHEQAAATYNEALQLVERRLGFEHQRALTALAGLGSALSKSGHHHEAVPRLQRVLAMQRAYFGLFDLRQQSTLMELAASLTALDRKPEAQNLMIYRARVAEVAHGEGDPKMIPALCDLGNWFAETGRTPEARMTFKAALDNVAWKLTPNHLAAVAPLRGLARAYMLRQSYPEKWLRPPTPAGCSSFAGPECSTALRIDAFGHPVVLPKRLYPEGEEALRQALRILEADPRASVQERVDTLIQLGDWFQIKASPRESLTYYQQAWQLSTSDNAGSVAAMSTPARVYYPTPMIAAHVPTISTERVKPQHVQVEFTVLEDGSVAHARIVDHDTREQYARDVLDAIRAARFRPKFVDGRAVVTSGIVYRETLWITEPAE